jgi:hypothetical protein
MSSSPFDRLNYRDPRRSANGWLGSRTWNPLAGWWCWKKHTPSAETQRLVPRLQRAEVFAVRAQALRLFLPYMQTCCWINLLIQKRFGGQCRWINSGFAVDQKYPGNFADYW